ncbi:GNAT family N-acetyltransferase [Xylanimonas protaetiae]|uniref:GNAT family N-acetyltransferase n=1 Tax=Xylanimonas protaetiae TaxID=2509457 RepID=A0A4P6F513_9MICO|nr:GNAT family N-acetyltransferase [Xylanimonas protaetiae]QAY70694.1 GNAT family N-acetyltransferase [Xylanimonas protaetiae]
MPAPLVLPPDLSQRPLEPSDAAAVTAIIAAGELLDTGEVEIEEADIVAEWSRPSFDLGASTVGVSGPEGDLVAYAEVSGGDRGDLGVHPEQRGRGLEPELARWLRERAGEGGADVVGLPSPQGSPTDRALETLGWAVRWTSWVLVLPEGAAIPARDLPAGYVVREAREDEREACWQVIEDAFLEWSVRERRTFEDWAATVAGRPGFEPWHLRVVVDAEGVVVAACVILLTTPGGLTEGYVDSVATRRDERGRGIAQALLADAFAVAREHGAARSSLATDSRTGALGLYRKLGMEVVQTWVNRAAATVR